ncbi:MAG: thiamine pyrophosphate-binding protein, partial [Clostridiales bacterium]|nr:thiamine pyrophosphate-binding protein [Clostridiales bacterium]
MAVYKIGEAFINVLNAHGLDKVYLNPGGELAAFQSYVGVARAEGRQAPQIVLCLDESVATAAAYGNYMVTGKPQIVMAHSELGLLQLGSNLQSLQWGRVPAVILTGYANADVQRTLWNGQPHDQGNILRHVVKYDRMLKGDEDFHDVLYEAFRIACTEPTGPVYISFPMGYFSRDIEKPASLPAAAKTEALPAANKETLGQMADILLGARNPLVISGFAGRYHENVGALVDLAETLSATAITGYSWMNFPSAHPLCAGIEQIGGSRKSFLDHEEADVVLVLDYDVPYVGGPPRYEAGAKILQIDVDPLTQGRSLWGRDADIFVKADAREAIPALTKLLKDKITTEKQVELDARFKRIAAKNEAIRQAWYETAQNLSDQDPISPDYLFYCLNQLIDEDTIVINHTLAQCASVTEQIV